MVIWKQVTHNRMWFGWFLFWLGACWRKEYITRMIFWRTFKLGEYCWSYIADAKNTIGGYKVSDTRQLLFLLKWRKELINKGVFSAALIKKCRYWPNHIDRDWINAHFENMEVGHVGDIQWKINSSNTCGVN